jgi:hypothetical protein
MGRWTSMPPMNSEHTASVGGDLWQDAYEQARQAMVETMVLRHSRRGKIGPGAAAETDGAAPGKR